LSNGDINVILEQDSESKNLLKSLDSFNSLLQASTTNYSNFNTSTSNISETSDSSELINTQEKFQK
jgi:hypothetical protein